MFLRHVRRYTIRGLLLAVAAIAAAMAWFGNEVRRAALERNVALSIQEYGGGVRYDWDVAEGAITSGVHLNWENAPPAPEWLRNRFGQNIFCRAVAVDFNLMDEGTDLQGLRYARKLPHLKQLYIGWLAGDTSPLLYLDSLADLHGLETLALPHLGLEDHHLTYLQSLHQLKRLHLNDNQLSDACLGSISHLGQLRELNLYANEISDAGLVSISHFVHIEILNVGRNKLGDAGLWHLRRLEKLRSLCLEGANLSDEGLRHLYGLTLLESIDLTNTKATPAGVAELKQRLHRLKYVYVDG